MFPMSVVKRRYNRLQINRPVCIETNQQITLESAVEALHPFYGATVTNPMVSYAVGVLKFAAETSAALETAITYDIAKNVVPGIKDLGFFTNLVSEFSNDMIDSNVALISEAVSDIKICDRIINNQERLSARFNFNKIISESVNAEDCVKSLCTMIDTYNIRKDAKYNIALENILFCSDRSKLLTPENILTYTTEYFLIGDSPISDIDYKRLGSVLEHSDVYDSSIVKSNKLASVFMENYKGKLTYRSKLDLLIKMTDSIEVRDRISRISDVTTEDDAARYIYDLGYAAAHLQISDNDRSIIFGVLLLIPKITPISEEFINIEIDKYVNVPNAKYGLVSPKIIKDDDESLEKPIIFSEMSIDDLASGTFLEAAIQSKSVNDLLVDFKAEQEKTVPKLKLMITKFFTKSPNAILDELPGVFNIIRASFIVAIATVPIIGPVLALITAMVNWFIKNSISEKETAKLLKYMTDERDKVESKLSSTSGDEKHRLTQYYDELEKDIKKIKVYAEDFKSEDSYEEDFDINDFTLETATIMLANITTLAEHVAAFEMTTIPQTNFDNALQSVSENGAIDTYYLYKTDRMNIDEIYSCADRLLHEDSNLFSDFIDLIAESSLGVDTAKTAAQLAYDNNKSDHILATKAASVSDNIEWVPCDFSPKLRVMHIANCAVEKVVEESGITSAKLIIQDAKRKIKDMSTKVKSAAQTANAYASGVIKGIEDSMTSDRREAIIKGKILPSFTQMMKYALTIAAAGVVFQPIGAVIAAIGIFSVNKSLTYREKKMILDEIETELKVVEKQISIAENDQNMNQYRIMLNMQKKLVRERQRIKYNMKAVGKNVPIPSAKEDK